MTAKVLRWMMAVATLIGTTSSLGADVIFTNINFSTTPLLSVIGSAGPSNSYAAAFTPFANATMTEVQVYVWGNSSCGPPPCVVPPTFDLSLYSNGGGVPGSLRAALGTDLSAGPMPGIVAESGLASNLIAGTEYWLVMTPHDPRSALAWLAGGIRAVPTDVSFSSNGSPPWMPELEPFNAPQFEIDGTFPPTIPEPRMTALVAAGLGLIAFRVAARRRVFGMKVLVTV